MPTKQQLRRRVAAALGTAPCDLVVRDVRYLDVFSAVWREGNVAVHDGVVVGLEGDRSAKLTVDGRGKYLVPGFIDAHVHVESSLLTPRNFESVVLPHGTTRAICDPHELANVQGVKGIQYFLRAADVLKMDLHVMLSSCVPSTELETSGAKISAKDLVKLAKNENALGLAEMMNIPGVLSGSNDVMEKLEAFSGRVIDGHCPMVRGPALAAYAACGISNCHESSSLEEAQEKMRNGVATWIREGSVAKDLHALIPILNANTSGSVGFCTDDRNPLDIEEEGHLDFLIRGAIKHGVAPELVYRCSSWSVARHYGLSGVGAIAPGYVADLVLLEDPQSCSISKVWKGGKPIDEMALGSKKERFPNSLLLNIPEERDLIGPEGSVHIIEVIPGKIVTGRRIGSSSERGVARLSVIERHGPHRKPANAYVSGFGNEFNGAIASSVGHDCHNVSVVGTDLKAMRMAVSVLKKQGGGFCVVRGETVLATLALPFGGLMSAEDPKVIVQKLRELRKASREIGCPLKEPFLQLAFLSLPVIPSLKLTDMGLVDVDRFKIIGVRAA